MTSKELLHTLFKALDDKHAQEIVILDMKAISLMADFCIICHGNSEKTIQAIVRAVKQVVGEIGLKVNHVEGLNNARWVLIDIDNVVIHIFHSEERKYYNLETLWESAPKVNIQLEQSNN